VLQLEQESPVEETNFPLEEKPKTEKILSPSPPQLGQANSSCLFDTRTSNLTLHFLQIYSNIGIYT
jgi:hypothetical protein